MDDDYPNETPKLYAPGIINVEGRFQQNLTMSPDGTEHLFTETDSAEWRYERILRVRTVGNEIVVDTPQFVTDFSYKNVWFIGEPMISPDNQYLYFIADYPPNLWQSQRTSLGDWSEPVEMDSLSTEKDDWYPTFSQHGTLYFTNGTVYKSTLEQGKYISRTALSNPPGFNDVRDPCISPDEDYMIFTAEDTTNDMQSDLFISFLDEQRNWSVPRNLGNEINTKHREFAPYISPDGKFLFFSRRDQWQNATFSNVYWVSLEVVEKLRLQAQ